MTQEELDKIVEQHQHWIKEDCEGWEDMKANLSGANLTTMATINYNGMKLEEFTSDKPVIFDPPKECLCWDEEKDADYHNKEDDFVLAYIPLSRCPFITKGGAWYHGAIFPEKPAPRRATNRELAKWLAQGNGEFTQGVEDSRGGGPFTKTSLYYSADLSNDFVTDEVRVRKWDDTEWHEPDVEYMGIADVTTFEGVVKREGKKNEQQAIYRNPSPH